MDDLGEEKTQDNTSQTMEDYFHGMEEWQDPS